MLTFMGIEFIVETVYKKTSEILELLQMNPEAPKSLEMYYNLQINKGASGLLLSLLELAIARFKYQFEINSGHLLGVFAGWFGYSVFLFVNHYQLISGFSN